MRRIGTLPRDFDPKTFSDHLLTLGITSRIDDRPEGWDVWIHHEDHVARAKGELDEYLKDPDDPRYHVARESAKSIRREAERLDRQYRKNFRQMSGHWDGPNIRGRPLTSALVGISIAVYVAQSLLPFGWRIFRYLTFSTFAIDEFGQRHPLGLDSILHGEVWRLVTPIFLHFSIMHIAFNMWALWVLGGLIEERRGTRTLAMLVFITAVTSNVGQYVYNISEGHLLSTFGGMSGVVYGLFGYVWMKGRVEPHLGMILHPRTVQTMLLWLLICFTGAVGNIANAAHVVGLLAGIVLGLTAR